MDSSTSSARRPQNSRSHAIMFRQSLDPTTGRIPEPRTPKRGRFGGTSLAVFSRDRKRAALGEIDHFGLWQGARLLLRLYVQYGRGTRCRSWRSDRAWAEIMARSGLGTYSIAHVRRCRRDLEDIGLVRSVAVTPHSHHGCAGADRCKSGHFPSAKAPDVDGGGVRANVGGRVVEVNLAAILREGALWEGPLREMGWQDAREAREAGQDAPSAAPAAAEPPRLVALPGGRQDDEELEAAAIATAAELAEDAGDLGPPPIMDDHGGVIMDAHSCDLGSPSENLSRDHGPPRSDGPGAACPPGTETPAHAGGFESETHDASLEAARAAPPASSPSGSPRLEAIASPQAPSTRLTRPDGEREQRTRGEQPSGQREVAIVRSSLVVTREQVQINAAWAAAAALAASGQLDGDAALAFGKKREASRVVPIRGGGGSSSGPQAPPAPPPARAPRLFEDAGPIGRNGERPPGWRGPGGGGRST